MAGNSIGHLFRVTTFGESHGPALGCIVDGLPPGLPLTDDDLQQELERRRPGQSPFTSQRKEDDTVRILSGVFDGRTTGCSIGLIVDNHDQRSADYEAIKSCFRPGHADYTYQKKYGIRDYRGGGRASARETVMRVAAGAIAKKYLCQIAEISIRGYVAQIGDVVSQQFDWEQVEKNPFFFPDGAKLSELEQLLESARQSGDSIGARVVVIADNVPAGLGEPVFDRLDADLAHALMSINAVKGVAIGDGFDVVAQRGSQHRDEMVQSGFLSNHAGGVLGGISSGQPIIVQLALKPTSSILSPGRSVDLENQAVTVVTRGRHDPCVGIRAVPIAEAMVAIVLLDHLLRHRGQCSSLCAPLTG